LRVLILHNRYRLPGGEDVAVAAQAKLLRERGHDVELVEKDNREIDSYGFLGKAALFFKMAENSSASAEVSAIVSRFKPHVAHVHNTLPLLSPSIYAPLKKSGVKVIQYLHNYRLICPAGTLFRDGAPCTLCVDGGLKHAVKHKCWSNSTFATLGLTRMLDRHRRARTWHTHVDLFVALNSYMRELLATKGLVPADKIIVQPNYIPLNEIESGAAREEFVFLGRLTPEKGVATLLQASRLLPEASVKIIGGGPLLEELKLRFPAQPSPFLGQLLRDEALAHLQKARALIFPSLWPEGCPTTILEAFAYSKPVIASRVPGATDLVDDGINGALFEPGDAEGLAACMKRLQDDEQLAKKLGRAAREKYEKMYSPAAGYTRMEENFKRLNLAVV